MTTDAVRTAATLVLWRDGTAGPEVLMGQRGAGAVFMPSKFVFPGGRVDPEDEASPRPGFLPEACRCRLLQSTPPDAPSPEAMVAAALRELTEETGLVHRDAPTPTLRFIFRAVTPPGKSRRFDARFFLAHAAGLEGKTDDFASASGELQHLGWLSMADAKTLDLPFITEIVLAEVAGLVAGGDQPGVPFFDNTGPTPQFRRLV